MHTVFPAHAGMSPARKPTRSCFFSFPRTRGDEPPASIDFGPEAEFSPHTRG